MNQTMLLKLAPTSEQAQALLDTMYAFNAACDYVASQAFEANGPLARRVKSTSGTKASNRLFGQKGLSSMMSESCPSRD